MADRSSAAVFSMMFTRLASDPTAQHIAWARELWEQTSNFDFTPRQLCCDEELSVLGLAKRGVDPNWPDDGETWIYAD